MGYDPSRHHRHSIRLSGYRYDTDGVYCVTLCVLQRQMLFGKMSGGLMLLNEAGRLVQSEWLALPARFPKVYLEDFVIMPNHLHGLIVLSSEARLETSPPVPELGDVVGAFKSLSTRAVSSHLGEGARRIWQRNYYEQIVRSDSMLNGLRQYIADNPGHWQDDPENCPSIV